MRNENEKARISSDMAKTRIVRLSKEELKRRSLVTVIEGDVSTKLEGELPDVLRTITEWIEEHGDFDEVHLSSECYWDYTSWQLLGYRLENDEEYARRIAQLKSDKSLAILMQEEAERKVLSSLLSKYGEPSKEDLGLV